MFDIVKGKGDTQTILLTRGGFGNFHINIFDKSGFPYILEDGEIVEFTVRKYTTSKDVLIHKTGIDIDLNGSDTQNLDFGVYTYDVQLTHANGRRDTFIKPGEFIIRQEVTYNYPEPNTEEVSDEVVRQTETIQSDGLYLTGYLSTDINPFDLVFTDPNNDGNIIVTRKPKEV